MDNAQDTPSELAARWYARLRAPDCTAEERAQFEAWRARDPRNAAAYAAAERMNDALAKLAMADPRLKSMVDQAASAGATLPDDEADEAPGKPKPLTITAGQPITARRHRIARRFAWAASVAAAAVSVLALLALGGTEPARSGEGYRYAGVQPVQRYTSGASRRAVTLDDGTRVYLDVTSIVEVRFDAAKRDVALVQGRALFDAAHDAVRPFVVTIDTERVTALGTVFQVERAPSEVVVTLAQGTVTVTSQTGGEAVQLAPGEELRSSAGNTRWSKRSVDALSATSWSFGKHLFRERSLSEAVREINRYADKRVRLASARLGELAVSGEFVIGDSETTVAALAAALPLRVVQMRTEIVLYPKQEPAESARF